MGKGTTSLSFRWESLGPPILQRSCDFSSFKVPALGMGGEVESSREGALTLDTAPSPALLTSLPGWPSFKISNAPAPSYPELLPYVPPLSD